MHCTVRGLDQSGGQRLLNLGKCFVVYRFGSRLNRLDCSWHFLSRAGRGGVARIALGHSDLGGGGSAARGCHWRRKSRRARTGTVSVVAHVDGRLVARVRCIVATAVVDARPAWVAHGRREVTSILRARADAVVGQGVSCRRRRLKIASRALEAVA